jgi:hypothetical protein
MPRTFYTIDDLATFCKQNILHVLVLRNMATNHLLCSQLKPLRCQTIAKTV